jgi:hypothetical protein
MDSPDTIPWWVSEELNKAHADLSSERSYSRSKVKQLEEALLEAGCVISESCLPCEVCLRHPKITFTGRSHGQKWCLSCGCHYVYAPELHRAYNHWQIPASRLKVDQPMLPTP